MNNGQFLDANGANMLFQGAKYNGVPIKVVTKAEYTALSDEEKNSEIVWLVTDAEEG